MKGLILHCGANAVDEVAVREAVTPVATASHVPVPHGMVLDLVGNMLTHAGWAVTKREYGLFKGGAQMFGVWAIQNGSGGHPDYALALGIRNSHDKKFPISVGVGSSVFVCDNLCFSGLISLAAKHTKNVIRDLPQKTFDLFGKLEAANLLQDKRIGAYKERAISTTEVHDFLVRSVDEKVIPNSYVPQILKEIRTPTHEEFLMPANDYSMEYGNSGNERRSAWTLMNAYTERFKSTNALDLPGRTVRLHGMLDELTFGEVQGLEEVDATVVETTPRLIDAGPGMPPVMVG
mgnify:FL=1